MANVSINALSLSSIKSIIQARFLYAHSMRRLVETGLTNCPVANRDSVIKNKRQEESDLLLLASKLGISGLLEGPAGIAWLEKQKVFTATQHGALAGYFSSLKPEKPESNDSNTVITANEAISGVLVEQQAFLEAVRMILNNLSREWVLLVKGTYSLNAKNGSPIKKTAGQLQSHSIACKQWMTILRYLEADPNKLFSISRKLEKMDEWAWDSQSQKEEAIKVWAVNGLPELRSDEKQTSTWTNI